MISELTQEVIRRNEPKAIDIDTIIAGDDDVSHWRDRHTVWYKS